ncbi:MAG TPA: DivIVA domain-containing protein [Balneolaceae bacterium]|nr:DivIVA domain-containing protein [Balneolaceae bacterium]
MRLTALEIRQQEFEKSLRGCDPTEVKAFLNLVANEWEHLESENKELEREIKNLENKLSHYEQIEEALREALQSAKESAETKLEKARNEAENKIEKAERKADDIVREAREERHQIRQSIKQLLNRRKEIIAGIHSYLQVAQESIEQFDRDESQIFNRPENLQSPTKEPGSPSQETSKETSATSKTDKLDTKLPASVSPPGTENIDELVNDLE